MLDMDPFHGQVILYICLQTIRVVRMGDLLSQTIRGVRMGDLLSNILNANVENRKPGLRF